MKIVSAPTYRDSKNESAKSGNTRATMPGDGYSARMAYRRGEPAQHS